MSIISDIRKDYKLQTLSEADVAESPIDQFDHWFKDVLDSAVDEPSAFTLATVTNEGKPSARILLLKGYDENGFVFFTNYSSNKGNQLAGNHHAAMVFFWKELERQVRIEGTVEKVSSEESDAYFYSRPEGSRIGAWSSPQSEVIERREVIEENAVRYKEMFAGKEIPRPSHWGGYRLKPSIIEFWQGRTNRLHDRIRYCKLQGVSWNIERLAP